MLPTPPRLPRNTALFLDLDGTLLELARTPESVVVPEGLVGLLQAIEGEFGGALAVITGRPLADVDRLFDPWQPIGAGLHGLEFRWPGAAVVRREDVGSIGALATRLRKRFCEDSAILVEDKGASVALHYRLAPERAAECERAMIEATRDLPALRLLKGHSVIEALPSTADKGRAIARLMGCAPFSGRVPAFIGDDVTDEDAFPVVGTYGGLCVKVGRTSSFAAHGLDGPRDVLEWLRSSLRSLRSGDEPCART